MRPHVWAFLALFFLLPQLKAQDPVFSQFYANPLYLNPAFAGSEICPRLTINYRNQWPRLESSYTTYAASYDQLIGKAEIGYGLTLLYDRAGEGSISQTDVVFSLAKPVRLSQGWSLSLGMQAKYGNRRLEWESLTFYDMLDSRRGFVNQTAEELGNSINYFDMHAGIALYHQHFFGGFSTHHIAEPTVGLSEFSGKLPRRYTAHMGGWIPLKGRFEQNFSLSPNVIFTMQGKFRQLNAGLYAQMHMFVIGSWYRMGDALIGLVGYENNGFGVGYSFDFPFSSRQGLSSGGAHEISIKYTFACKAREQRHQRLRCPHF